MGPTEHALTADKIPYETGIARYREIARGQIGDASGFFNYPTLAECYRVVALDAANKLRG